MPELTRVPITAESDLRRHAVSILRRINEDERGGLLFLMNPVFALEDAGFDLSPAMQRHIRRGLRYGTKSKARLRELEGQVEKLAGHPVNAAADGQVARLLFEELKLTAPSHPPKPPTPEAAAPAPGGAAKRGSIYEADREDEAGEAEPAAEAGGRVQAQRLPPVTAELLDSLRRKHPVVPALIELRQLSQSGWRFVNRATYEKVKNGATVTLLRRVRFKRRPAAGTKRAAKGGK